MNIYDNAESINEANAEALKQRGLNQTYTHVVLPPHDISFWAMLGESQAKSSDGKRDARPELFEWKEVFYDKYTQKYVGLTNTARTSFKTDSGKIICPAREKNGMAGYKSGTIVKLYPGELFYDGDDAPNQYFEFTASASPINHFVHNETIVPRSCTGAYVSGSGWQFGNEKVWHRISGYDLNNPDNTGYYYPPAKSDTTYFNENKNTLPIDYTCPKVAYGVITHNDNITGSLSTRIGTCIYNGEYAQTGTPSLNKFESAQTIIDIYYDTHAQAKTVTGDLVHSGESICQFFYPGITGLFVKVNYDTEDNGTIVSGTVFDIEWRSSLYKWVPCLGGEECDPVDIPLMTTGTYLNEKVNLADAYGYTSGTSGDRIPWITGMGAGVYKVLTDGCYAIEINGKIYQTGGSLNITIPDIDYISGYYFDTGMGQYMYGMAPYDTHSIRNAISGYFNQQPITYINSVLKVITEHDAVYQTGYAYYDPQFIPNTGTGNGIAIPGPVVFAKHYHWESGTTFHLDNNAGTLAVGSGDAYITGVSGVLTITKL